MVPQAQFALDEPTSRGFYSPALRQEKGAKRGTVLLCLVRRGFIPDVSCNASQDALDDHSFLSRALKRAI